MASPGGIVGTELWLKADSGVVGSSVSLWQDQSGNGRDAQQGVSTYQPSFLLNGSNFNPTFHYTNHFLDVPYSSALNGNDLTVFAVVHQDGGSSYRSPWTTRDDYPQRGHIMYYEGGRYKYWNGEGSGWSQLLTADTTGAYEILTARSIDVSTTVSRIEKKVFLQGTQIGATSTSNFSPNTIQPFRVGKGATEKVEGAYPWSGDISEIIVYANALSDLERNRVESYLAIKYGITLNQSSTYPDYRDSLGTVIWSQSINSTYTNDIAGLGVDVASSLNQKVSTSINTDAIVTLATTNNFSTSNTDTSRVTLGSDRSFLLWSNNNGASTWSSTDAPMNAKILNRVWKVQKTGIQNSVSIQVDVDDIDFNIDAFVGKLYLVKGDDLSTAYPLEMTQNGSLWSISNIEFRDGELFSFVSDVIFPNIVLSKSSCVLSDLVNGTVDPKRIPGATIRYAIEVTNKGDSMATNVEVNDTVGLEFDETSIVNLQVQSGACDCLGVTSTSNNGANGTADGVSPIVLDFADVLGGSIAIPTIECGYFEVQLK